MDADNSVDYNMREHKNDLNNSELKEINTKESINLKKAR